MERGYIGLFRNLNKAVSQIVEYSGILELSAESHNNVASSFSYLLTHPSAPHFLQNFAPSLFSAWHFGHFISPPMRGKRIKRNPGIGLYKVYGEVSIKRRNFPYLVYCRVAIEHNFIMPGSHFKGLLPERILDFNCVVTLGFFQILTENLRASRPLRRRNDHRIPAGDPVLGNQVISISHPGLFFCRALRASHPALR